MSEQTTSEYYRLFGNLNSAEKMVLVIQSSGYYYQKMRTIEDNTLTVEMKEEEGQATLRFTTTIKLKESGKGEQMLDLHSPQAKEFIDELMLDAFMTYDDKGREDREDKGTGTGHVLAATYIQSKLSNSSKVFYTAIVRSETVKGHDNTYNFRRNIMADLINSVKKAKELKKSTATLFITSRGGQESHDFCMTVNTDIFGENGIIKDGKKLSSENCIIFDSSEAFLKNSEFEDARQQLCNSFLITADELKKCSFYNDQSVFGQVGSRCSDYAAEAYILLNDDNSDFRKNINIASDSGKDINIADLNKNKLQFYTAIAKNMNNRYKKYIETARNIPRQNNRRKNWNINATAGQKLQVEQDVSHLEASQQQRNPLAGVIVGEIQKGETPGERRQRTTSPSVPNNNKSDKSKNHSSNRGYCTIC